MNNTKKKKSALMILLIALLFFCLTGAVAALFAPAPAVYAESGGAEPTAQNSVASAATTSYSAKLKSNGNIYSPANYHYVVYFNITGNTLGPGTNDKNAKNSMIYVSGVTNISNFTHNGSKAEVTEDSISVYFDRQVKITGTLSMSFDSDTLQVERIDVFNGAVGSLGDRDFGGKLVSHINSVTVIEKQLESIGPNVWASTPLNLYETISPDMSRLPSTVSIPLKGTQEIPLEVTASSKYNRDPSLSGAYVSQIQFMQNGATVVGLKGISAGTTAEGYPCIIIDRNAHFNSGMEFGVTAFVHWGEVWGLVRSVNTFTLTPAVCSITFEGNTGTLAPDMPTSVTYNKAYSFPEPTKADEIVDGIAFGYKFLGWNIYNHQGYFLSKTLQTEGVWKETDSVLTLKAKWLKFQKDEVIKHNYKVTVSNGNFVLTDYNSSDYKDTDVTTKVGEFGSAYKMFSDMNDRRLSATGDYSYAMAKVYFAGTKENPIDLTRETMPLSLNGYIEIFGNIKCNVPNGSFLFRNRGKGYTRAFIGDSKGFEASNCNITNLGKGGLVYIDAETKLDMTYSDLVIYPMTYSGMSMAPGQTVFQADDQYTIINMVSAGKSVIDIPDTCAVLSTEQGIGVPGSNITPYKNSQGTVKPFSLYYTNPAPLDKCLLVQEITLNGYQWTDIFELKTPGLSFTPLARNMKIVGFAPEVSLASEAAYAKTYDGLSVTLAVNASHATGGAMSYQWYRRGPEAAEFIPVAGATDASYSVTAVAESGSYYCNVVYKYAPDDSKQALSAVSDTVSVAIAPIELEIAWGNTELTYTGAAQVPEVSITNSDAILAAVPVRVYASTDNPVINAGTTSHQATAALNNANYVIASSSDSVKSFTISKATSIVNAQTDATTLYSGGDKPTLSLTAGDTEGTLAWDEGQDWTTAGTREFAWTFQPADGNYTVVTGTVSLTVKAVELNSISASLTQGNIRVYANTSLDGLKTLLADALTVTGTNNDGSAYNGGAAITGYTLSFPAGITAFATGDNTVIVNYGGKTAEITVTVSEKALTSIEIAAQPTKTTYAAFDTFNATGLVVTARYNDGTSKDVTNYTVKYAGGNTSLRYAETSVTVSYTEKGVTKTAEVTGLTVNKKQFTTPTVGGTYTYDGSEQTVTLLGFTDEYMTVANNTRTNAGGQDVSVSLNDTDNCVWKDGTIAAQSVRWTIAAAKIEKPAADTTEFTYNGEAQTYRLAANNAYTIAGATQTDADSYQVTVSLNNPQGIINYEWQGGGSNQLSYDFVIGKKAVEKPSISGTYEYSGEEHTANVVTTEAYAVTGNVQTDAGEYTVTVTLTKNYKWSDNDAAVSIDLEWTIAQKKLTITPVYDTSAQVFVGGSLPAISANETTPGTIAWDDYTLTEAATDKAFGWTWTPTDAKNYETVTGSVDFDVLAVELASITASFDPGQNTVYEKNSLDDLKQYLTVAGINNDGTQYADAIEYDLSGALTVGTSIVTVTAKGTNLTATFSVAVTATALESIAVTTQPTRAAYTAFEDFDASGMVVTATFSHGTETITDYTVTGGANLQAGATSLTISYIYAGVTQETTVSITVAKASYDMSGVTFGDVTVKEDGKAHKIEVAGLPDGVAVAAYTGTNGYTAEGVSAAGVYEVTVTFSVADADNYNLPAAMKATLTINAAEITGGTDENGDTTVVIGGENGVAPGTSVKVEEKPAEDYKDSNIVIGDEKHAVLQATDIRLERGGAEVQPDGSVTVRLLIKEDLRGYENLKVLYIAPDGSVQDMNATRDGDYMVFVTTHFSVYAIVAPQSSLPVVTPDKPGLGGGAIFGIVFAVVIVLLIIFLLATFFFRKDKNVGFKEYCVAAVKGLFKKGKAEETTPAAEEQTEPETSGTESDEEEIAAAVVESIEVSEDEIEEEAEDEGEITIDDEPEELNAEIVSEGKTVRVTYRRTFLAKLIQGSGDNKRYYSAIKNEFKSFGVTSSVAASGNNFSYKRKPLGRVVIAGDVLKLYLALNPADIESKYNAHDASEIKKYEKTPCFVRVKSDMGLKKALVLIARMMKAEGIERNPRYVWTDIASIYPDEPLETLIAKDLVKVIERQPVDAENKD